MNEESLNALIEEYQDWSDEKLIRTYSNHDCDQYAEVAFEAMRRVSPSRLMVSTCSPELAYRYKFSGWRYEDEIE